MWRTRAESYIVLLFTVPVSFDLIAISITINYIGIYLKAFRTKNKLNYIFFRTWVCRMENCLYSRNEFTWNRSKTNLVARSCNRGEVIDRTFYENGKHGGAVSVAGEEIKHLDENRLCFGTYFQRPHRRHVVLLHPHLFSKGGSAGADRCWCSLTFR